MRAIIIAILLLSLSNAATFGYSRVTIDRTWTIEDSQNGTFEFNGSLVANNSNQRVMYFSTEPEMEVYVTDDGTIHLHHQGMVENGTTVLKAHAVVNMDYDTRLLSDVPLPRQVLNHTVLTEPDEGISLQAWNLAHEESSLMTIRDLVNWVHSSMKYDIGYWGLSKSARQAFQERRGVCVEYSHLLISMARSLGFDTRYVSGYVQSDAWQPHAWAEIYVPGYGWLPVDATFGQVGILDSSHLAIHYGRDQSDVYDVLSIRNPNATIVVSDEVATTLSSEDGKGLSISMEADPESYVADVALHNSRPDHAYGAFTITVPEGYGGSSSSVVLLAPNETLHIFQGINHSLIRYGYVYDIPISASFNDAKAEVRLSISPGNDWVGDDAAAPLVTPCPSALLLLAPLLLVRILLK